MEDVVGSVFDLMGRTSDPILEEEVINERVDYMFEVCLPRSVIDTSLNLLTFAENGSQWRRYGVSRRIPGNLPRGRTYL